MKRKLGMFCFLVITSLILVPAVASSSITTEQPEAVLGMDTCLSMFLALLRVQDSNPTKEQTLVFEVFRIRIMERLMNMEIVCLLYIRTFSGQKSIS